MNEDFEEKKESLDKNAESFDANEEFFDGSEKWFDKTEEVSCIRPKPYHYWYPCCCCCCCRCNPGELVKNGGMESIWQNKPKYWHFFNPFGIESEDGSGNVHTGEASVNIKKGSGMEQRIDCVRPCNSYEFSFYAKGMTLCAGLIAKVIFLTYYGPKDGAIIKVNPGDMIFDGRDYGYYRKLTTMAPRGTYAAIIKFIVIGPRYQKVNIDDVSFSAK